MSKSKRIKHQNKWGQGGPVPGTGEENSAHKERTLSLALLKGNAKASRTPPGSVEAQPQYFRDQERSKKKEQTEVER